MTNGLPLAFTRQYDSSLKHLKLKGRQAKTIDAYTQAIRRLGRYFDYRIDELLEAQHTSASQVLFEKTFYRKRYFPLSECGQTLIFLMAIQLSEKRDRSGRKDLGHGLAASSAVVSPCELTA